MNIKCQYHKITNETLGNKKKKSSLRETNIQRKRKSTTDCRGVHRQTVINVSDQMTEDSLFRGK
jgi:hypothetical protein